MAKVISKTKVTKSIGFNAMWIAAKYPSGGSVRYSVTRNGERLTLAFSNNENESKVQGSIFSAYVQCRKNESYMDVFNRLEIILKSCESGKEVIAKMNVSLNQLNS